ncbi:cysteine hydrolase family protein [Roseovarius ramblicola]|uniref:Cysteine hydrolase family protein n=2 Tax=Roseovarius ramblicola TaxID=2022336 RepID=A0ABV5I045_9RHOB
MRAALLLIDFQSGFDAPGWGARNNPQAEARAARLPGHWRGARAPVIHVRHLSREQGSPLTPETGGTAFKPGLGPQDGEPVFGKRVNSTFIGTALEAHLHEAGLGALVICGLTTPHCVSTTVRMAANLGFDVTLAHDACAAFATNADTGWKVGTAPMDAQAIHDSAVSHLHGEFARAVDVEELLDTAP